MQAPSRLVRSLDTAHVATLKEEVTNHESIKHPTLNVMWPNNGKPPTSFQSKMVETIDLRELRDDIGASYSSYDAILRQLQQNIDL